MHMQIANAATTTLWWLAVAPEGTNYHTFPVRKLTSFSLLAKLAMMPRFGTRFLFGHHRHYSSLFTSIAHMACQRGGKSNKFFGSSVRESLKSLLLHQNERRDAMAKLSSLTQEGEKLVGS